MPWYSDLSLTFVPLIAYLPGPSASAADDAVAAKTDVAISRHEATSHPKICNPWQHLPAEELQVGDGLLMVQQTALAHHQEVAEAAHMVIKRA